MTGLIHLENAGLTYPTASGPYAALTNLSLTVEAGEHVAIIGRSGSGKSSLLNLITGIDRPTQGRVLVAGTEIATLGEGPLALWRGRNVGIVFQFFQLIPTLTVMENLMLPMELVGAIPKAARRERARALLDQVGIAAHGPKLPGALSGGEQQRAALARALVNDPPLLVADEPTGNLDSRNADLVSGLLADLVKAGKTVVVVTHERRLDSSYDRIVTLVDGQIASDVRGQS
jgi:putative ABC transport system ATP-binding protein